MTYRAPLLALIALTFSAAAFAQGDPAPADEEAVAAPPAPIAYKLDPNKGAVYVLVHKDTTTTLSGMSHDHVMTAKEWTGSVTWTEGAPEACAVKLSVPVDKLAVDLPEMRTKVGYDSELSDGQRGDVRKNMLSGDQLNANKFPTIDFSSKSCAGTGADFKVTGTLTIRGVSKEITVPMKIRASDTSFTASGKFSVRGTDFGMDPFSALLGQLKNLDELQFVVDVAGAP